MDKRSRYKELAVVSFVALYTAIFFSFAAHLFASQQEWSISLGSGIAVAGIIWVAIVALASILAIDTTAVSFTIAIIPSVALLAVGRLSYTALIGAGLLFVLTYAAQQSIYSEIGRYIHIRMSTICSFGVRMLLFGMLLSFVVLSVPLVRQSIEQGTISIPTNNIQSVVSMVSSNSEEITKAVNNYIQSRAQSNSVAISVIVIAIALLAVRTLVPILMWPALALVALMFWIARKTGLVTITERNVAVEHIEL